MVALAISKLSRLLELFDLQSYDLQSQSIHSHSSFNKDLFSSLMKNEFEAFPGYSLCIFFFRHVIFVTGLLVQWRDSRFGCERSRVRLLDRPLLTMHDCIQVFVSLSTNLNVQERLFRKMTPEVFSYPITFFFSLF